MPRIHLIPLLCLAILIFGCSRTAEKDKTLRFASTVAGADGEFGETFGIAVKDSDVYVSDGQRGNIRRIHGGRSDIAAQGLHTPSAIAFTPEGKIAVADTGANRVVVQSLDEFPNDDSAGPVVAPRGFRDGDVREALFNGPMGIAVAPDGRIFVADTYNDRIRVIANGEVSTLAGSTRGFADSAGVNAKFDTPCGVAVWEDKVLVADTGNRRIRVIEPNGVVWTLAGTGDSDLKDGGPLQAGFVEPTAITVGPNGTAYIADGDAIREIGGIFPMVRTLSAASRGLSDGPAGKARFNAPSGLAVDADGSLLIADSNNRLIRRLAPDKATEISKEQILALRGTAEEFRKAAPARWPYDPPEAKREIAGTLGEIRGDTTVQRPDLHFHNGLDIAGGYGEVARFVRDEKVLSPLGAENFGSLRELLRMPTMGYIHIRLGRDQNGKPFNDGRFEFTTDSSGKLTDVRVPRGSAFKAGEPIGTLNAMNHVHLIAGRPGSEMNALDALVLPGVTDTKPPVIEAVRFYSGETEIPSTSGKTTLSGRVRVVMQAYDQVDGNIARRKLGLYQAGYQLLRSDRTPLSDIEWNIRFDRTPRGGAVPFVYAKGSKSGATGDTIFDYIVTNHVEGDDYSEGAFDTTTLEPGSYVVRVWAGDYFGNNSYVDTPVEVKR